jgi:ABC-2 type transport system permease protein
MLSGMIFPINNMPPALQYLSLVVPARWFIDAVRKVMIQGVGFTMVWEEMAILTGMILLLLTVTILKTKKRLE